MAGDQRGQDDHSTEAPRREPRASLTLQDARLRRTRVKQAGLALLAIAAVLLFVRACGSSSPSSNRATTQDSTSTTSPIPTTSTTVPAPPSDTTGLARVARITGDITPKSIVASPTGLVSAQNMMYSHNLTYHDPKTRKLVATIPDSVELSKFGVADHPGVSKGAPVEAAFTSNGKKQYVSNYSMYGEGFGPEGSDQCTAGDGTDTSYVYRIDVKTRKIDQVIHVGAVPKYVDITPDQRHVLVTNWCSWNLSVIDVAKAKVVQTIKLDRYPRGIAVSPDSKTAYIALMGANRVAKVDLASGSVSTLASTGNGPRHIVISPDGKYLYVTNNGSGTVSKVDRVSGKVIDSISTGTEPRSMAISTDGTAVYVVNYDSSTVTKVRTSDMSKITTAGTDAHPIGIAYEPTTHTIWVACYGGSIIVYDESKPAA